MNKYILIISFTIACILLYLYKQAYATKVILFHSPDCSHCVKIMSEWYDLVSKARFSLTVKTQEVNVDNKDDIESIKKLKNNYNISGWPTIVIIKDIKWRHYDGKKKSENIWNATL